uniref:NADH-ubiquinone oxidoreductase chain 4 n=1 Tax=Malachiinae sp. GENSP01 TaxID=1205562 RepID=A0A0S2MQI4_9CUCU|nr:NADH deshydrogenase subunit 4 [Malachiinae sp. GENSP01]
MMILFYMLMMIPLLLYMNFWMISLYFFMGSLIYMLNISMSYSFINLSYFIGWDNLSYSLILLSFWICMLMMLASEKLFKLNNYWKLFSLMNLLLLISLYLVFSSLNIFIFYLFFEVSLIPLLMLIIGWGYQPERIQAGMYLFFYTLMASLPMMIFIFYLYENSLIMMFFNLNMNINNLLLYFFMNLVFWVKMPMFIVHLWLPKAHVEAPISGSMILAGVMLKLGGYGMIRFMVLFIELGLKINLYFMIISLLGGSLISIYCVYLNDLKSLIAYSSVAHMSLVLCGIMSFSMWGFMGSLIMMLSHGLCSSGLFCLSNLNYERLESRSIYLNKGLMILIPSLSLWWFLFCAFNMGAPPSLNLLSEVILLCSIVSYSKFMMFMLIILSFFSAVYSLFLFSFSQHGKFFLNKNMFVISMREYLLLFFHLFPLNFLILKSDMFMLY